MVSRTRAVPARSKHPQTAGLRRKTRVDYTVSRLRGVVGTVTVREGSAALRPLSDVIVFADGHDQPAVLTRTDPEGRFVLDGLVPGTYVLGVAKMCLPRPTTNPGNTEVTLLEMDTRAHGDITIEVASRPQKLFKS